MPKKKYPYRNAFNSFFVPPLISVLTDYTAHSAYIQDEIDYYIAGDEYVREVLISEGIEDDKIKKEDKGEQILKNILSEDILEVKDSIEKI